ncbi:FimV/HubP family polar landmark protein [Alteromonas oceanisediminis]|uniref:FimV/HubP family polar landmark protein n=1 Tax=Alteromonas oceanisediminis TaxID=2836180 RepID=UPI001BD9E634|nr:FimV/HubP family polar landmark protein [Alteromonas oceanisediminis]MBT0587425.1 hypothetical protein [Alteromonas oceanisediminis]
MRSIPGLMMSVVFVIVFAVVTDTSAQTSSVQIKGPRDAQGQYSGAEYGPIDPSDTLWRIASRYRQNNNLSIYQVMVAIYDLNPDAFEQQNLNLLVDGATLRLPSERYIARIDREKARARAERDDAALRNQSASATPPQSNNIKPPVELVNKSDLTDTKNQLEQKLTKLDEQQLQQFELLRQEFASSIDGVQSLIDENRKVFERLDAVNEDLLNLRAKVDEQVQPQIDQQLALQQELLDLVKSQQAKQQEKEQASWLNALTSPLALIIGSGLLTLGLVGGFIAWLFKRNRSSQAGSSEPNAQPIPETAAQATQAPVNDMSDALVDDLATPDDADDLFNDDELLDDVLSEELGESLDDAVESELDSYADLSDEMLVPDDSDDGDSLFDDDEDELSKELDDVDMDELDGIDLSDDNEIDLSDSLTDDLDDELIDELDVESALTEDSIDDLFDEDDITDLDTDLIDELTGDDEEDTAEEPETSADQDNDTLSAPIDDDEEKPEISIDDLLEEQNPSNAPAGIEVDTENGVSGQMLEQLESEIATQGAELDKVTDEIIGELEQLEMMQGMMGDDDFMDEDDTDETVLEGRDVQESIQTLDEFASDIDPLDDMDDEDGASDPLTDELLAELEAENPPEATSDENSDDDDITVEDVSDPLTDELLSELEAEQDSNDSAADALSDELLAELEADANDIESDADFDAEETSVDEVDSDVPDEVTDELLAEFDLDDQADKHDEVTVESDSAEPELESASEEEILDVDGLADSVDEAEVEAEARSAEPEPESMSEEEILDVDGLADSVDEAKAEADSAEPELESASEEEILDVDGLADSVDEAEVEAEARSAEPEPESMSEEEILDVDGLADSVDEAEADAVSAEPELESTSEEEILDVDGLAESVDEAEADAGSAEPELESTSEEEILDVDGLADSVDDLDDIPSFAHDQSDAGAEQADDTIDDSILDTEFDEFSLDDDDTQSLPEQQTDAASDADELSDLPGLDDWLSDEDEDDNVVLEEIEGADFDELLNSIDSEVKGETELKLDNPDLDLDALFTDPDDAESDLEQSENDFVDVDQLLEESELDDGISADETSLNLEAALSEFSGIGDDDVSVDVDSGGSHSANLDLARAYIEMDETDAAIELLNDVVEYGNAEQQQEAQDILAAMNKGA